MKRPRPPHSVPAVAGHPGRLVVVALALLLLVACGGGAAPAAGEYPTESIRLLVPYGAGGPTDLTSRAYGAHLEQRLGTPVVVENQPGGSGALATQALIAAEPDGHTLALVTAGTMVLTPLANDIGYSVEDITPLGVMSEVPSVLAVGADSPHPDADALFAAARERPGTLTVAVPGATTPQGIELRRLRDEYGVEVTVVPFDGNAEMTTALLGANVDAILINASQDVVENIDAGGFVPLAVSSAERLDWLPDLPTLAESGFPELTLSGSTFGLAAPAGLPPEIAERIESAMRTAHGDPEVVEQIGDRYVGTEFVGAAGLAQVLERTRAVYGPILAN